MCKAGKSVLGVFVFCLLLLPGGAWAELTLTQDVIIASGNEVDCAHVKIDASVAGQVELAWRDSDGYARYSSFSAGAVVADIMGISRDGAVVRVGINSNKNVQQYTRVGPGSWTLSDTGYDVDGYGAPAGGYDVDPSTGLGGFLFKEDVTNDIVYVPDTGAAWSKTVLETNVSDAGYGRYDDLVYSATGDPIGAYKTYDPGIPGARIRAGKITGPGPLSTANVAFPQQHLDVTVAPDGTIYLVDDYSVWYTFLQKSENGSTWAYVSAVQSTPNGGSTGDDMDVAVAVAPDESRMAVLAVDYNLDATHPLTLFISENGGGSWDTTMLRGGVRGIADAAFDPGGNLYVAYYSEIDDALHLLVATVGPTCKATPVEPVDGKRGAYSDMVLKWTPCPEATSNDVYFGTDYMAVLNATHADIGTDMADIDGSGRVDLGDVVVLSSQWMTDPAGAEPSGDVTGDGFVDGDDLQLLIYAWLATGPGVYRGNVTGATYDAGFSPNGLTYYWRIDGVNDPCVWTGDVWSFKVNELVVFPETYGAVGDGVTDDTAAFYAAAQAIESSNGGVLRLMPGKTYRIGKQFHVPGEYPYWQDEPMFIVLNTEQRVLVDGQGSTLKANDGLHFGSFDPETGEPAYPVLYFVDFTYRADIGTMIGIQDCARVEIRDIILDGNMDNYVLGGLWGDCGRQCTALGMNLYSNDSTTVMNVQSHHHGLDGIYIADTGIVATDPCTPVYLYNVESCYNARQGLSWVGGIGLKAENCKFNHTGKGRFSSCPGAGVDIEAGTRVIREGIFINCDFVNNAGCAMIAETGDSADCTFTDCLFWGATSWAVWPTKPGFKFYDCDIYGVMLRPYGSSNPDEATQFYNCYFEDYQGQYDGMPLGSYVSAGLVEGHGENVLFDTCTFVANDHRALYIDYTSDHEIITNCSVYHKYNGLSNHGYQSRLYGVAIDNTHFYEDLPGENIYLINASSVYVGPNVVVDGPKCKWDSWDTDGLIGTIPQGNW